VAVKLLDDLLGGNADGRDEELGAGLDDNVDQLRELTLGVVVAVAVALVNGPACL